MEQQNQITNNIQSTQELFIACNKGDLSIINILLRSGIDPNIRDHLHRTPLMYAAIQGFSKIIELFIRNNAIFITARDLKGKTALWLASYKGNLQCVKLLLAHGAKMLPDYKRRDPLWIAASKGHVELVNFFLAKPLIVLRRDWNGINALDIAKANHHDEIVKLLELHLAEEKKFVTPELLEKNFYIAIFANNLVKIQATLATRKIHINDCYMKMSFLGHIIELGRIEILNYCLQQNHEINFNIPCDFRITDRMILPLNLLIDKIKQYIDSPEHSNIYFKFLRVLLAAKADPNFAIYKEPSPLALAIEYDLPMVVIILLEHRAKAYKELINLRHKLLREGELPASSRTIYQILCYYANKKEWSLQGSVNFHQKKEDTKFLNRLAYKYYKQKNIKFKLNVPNVTNNSGSIIKEEASIQETASIQESARLTLSKL